MPRPNKRKLACRRASGIGRAKRLRQERVIGALAPVTLQARIATNTDDEEVEEEEELGSSARRKGEEREHSTPEEEEEDGRDGREGDANQNGHELEAHAGEAGEGPELYSRPTPVQTPAPVPTSPPALNTTSPTAPVAPVAPIAPIDNPAPDTQNGDGHENGTGQAEEGAREPTVTPFTPVNPLNKPVPIPSSSAAAVTKTPCRQTLWRRRKRAEAAAAAAAATAITAATSEAPPSPDTPPAISLTHAQELNAALARWPRAVPQNIKREILLAAANDMEKLLKSKTLTPTGQDLVRHQQVLQFINAQLKNSRNAPRMEIAELVASTYRKGRDVAERIVKTEKEWVKNRIVPSGKQGRTAKVPSMIEDQATRRVVEQYIEKAVREEGISSQGLVKAVTDYWQSLESQDSIRNRIHDEENDDDDDDQAEAPAQGPIVPKKLSITTKTATRWLQLMGYTFKDGKYHLKADTATRTPKSENHTRQQQQIQQMQQQLQAHAAASSAQPLPAPAPAQCSQPSQIPGPPPPSG
ncbi:hypothetical protein L873DRAFT_1788137 [Choiromyces venosus 120613-1]|uniref:Uncharacterized protein n=1 Tax=Choiromyces venosus 120613-1 TaxID=1336337 RepID=A0A3N4K7A9_9PEZI|nr:hypothetical protein L873DRAFT_1788137 [Choiromyces venosus 120613-1]